MQKKILDLMLDVKSQMDHAMTQDELKSFATELQSHIVDLDKEFTRAWGLLDRTGKWTETESNIPLRNGRSFKILGRKAYRNYAKAGMSEEDMIGSSSISSSLDQRPCELGTSEDDIVGLETFAAFLKEAEAAVAEEKKAQASGVEGADQPADSLTE